MQSEDAGIATLSATWIRVAVGRGTVSVRLRVESQRIKGLTDITVDRSPVDRVLVPYNRVDALQEASKTGPDHVQASACIPTCAVRSQNGMPESRELEHIIYVLSRCQ